MHKDYTSINVLFQECGIVVDDIGHDYINNIKTIVIYASPIDSLFVCPSCGSISVIKNGAYTRTIKHIPMLGHSCIIKLKQHRLKCKDCNKNFNESCKLTKKYSTISNQLKISILYECKEKQSFKHISERFNISSPTVMKTFNDNVFIDRKSLSRVICIDEFKADTEYGKYALIIGDPVKGEILDVLPKRTQDYIYYYFQNLSIEERKIVQIVITDMNIAYRTVVRNLFFNSIHIVDRFHWIKLASDAFNKVRIRFMKEYDKRSNETRDVDESRELKLLANTMKAYYRLLIANRHRKEPQFFEEVTKKKINGVTLTRQEIIEFIINSDKDLETSYWLLQDLYKISICSSYETFSKDIEEWFNDIRKSKIKEFIKLIASYKAWMKEIRNSFILDERTKKRLTNGFIEGKNNICKVIKRVGFGYKKFDNLRNRILYIDNERLTIKNK